MKKEQIILPLAALFIGGALGYGFAPAANPVSSEPVVRTKIKEVQVASDNPRTTEALRKQIADLRRQLELQQRADREATRAESETPVAENRERRGRGEDWMERLKNEDPARYTAMTNEFAQRGRRMRERGRSTYEFLDSIDLTGMAEGDRVTVQNHKDLLARRDDLMAMMETASDEERRQLGPQMGQVMGEIRASNGRLRESLIKQTAVALGCQGEEIGQVAGTIMEIIQATENEGRGGPRGGGFGGPRGGGRGGRR